MPTRIGFRINKKETQWIFKPQQPAERLRELEEPKQGKGLETVISIDKPGLISCFRRLSFQVNPLSLKLTPKAQEIDDLGEEGPSGHGLPRRPS